VIDQYVAVHCVQKVNKDGVYKIAVLVGRAELESGTVLLRQLDTAAQESVPVGDLAHRVAALRE
jgi:histidyl-tRNA synthetase